MQGKKRFINLEKEEEEGLKIGWKTGKKAAFRQRCHYILLSNQKMSINNIAAVYQTTRQTVTSWFNRYEKEGIFGLHTAKGSGRVPIIRIDNETEVKKIEELVEKSPQNLKYVLSQIKEELGKEMSKKTLKRILKKKDGVGSVSEPFRQSNQTQ
jgi:transposase